MPDAASEPLFQLREHARKDLGFLMASLLSNAEPTLVAQARQSRSNAEQSQIYDAIRDIRLKGRPLQDNFIAAVLAGFDGLGQPAAPAATSPVVPPGPAPGTLRLESLGVVDNSLLEQQISIDNIASRAAHQHREALLTIGRQLARLTGSRRVDLDALPVGPERLARAFMESCTQAGVEPGAMGAFSKLFSRFVIDELGPFYQDCIGLFPAEASEAAPRPGIAEDVPLTPPAAQPEERVPDAQDAGWDLSRTPLLAPPGKAMAMPRSQLDEALLYVQESFLDPAKSFFSATGKGGVQALQIPELINDALAESGFSRPMSLPADVMETIGLIRVLFDHALRDARVPAAVRRISRLLQVPLLRASLLESDLLTTPAHPARLLFAEINAAAANRVSVADPATDDFPRLVQVLVMRVLGDYEKDPAVFVAALHDLRRYLEVHGGRSEPSPGTDPTAPAPAAPAAPSAPAPAPAPHVAIRPPASPEFVQLVDKLAPDQWLELRPSGAPRRRLQLLTRIPRSGLFVFADAEGAKAGEWSRNDLASMIENGEAVILKAASGGVPPGRR